MNYYQKAKDIYDMLGQGKMIEAFEKFYHQDVVMIEATGEERKGKDFNREFEKKFIGMIKEFHGFGVNSITSNENEKTTMVESWMEVTFMDGNRVKMEQVAVQHWQDDKIIRERFYYNAGK